MYSAGFLWADFPHLLDDAKWRMIKNYRNELLTRCDWTQMEDAALTEDEREAWREIRQALRNIPQNFTAPELVMIQESPNE